MAKEISILLFVIYLISCQSPANNNSAGLVSEKVTAEIYKTNCGACHGLNMEGASATALIKDNWQYGSWGGAMRNVIAYGIQGVDMPAFKEILKEDEIDSLISYIKNAQEEGVNNQAAIPKEIKTTDYNLAIEEIVSDGLKVPWAIAFVDDNNALITERYGRMRWLRNGELSDSIVGIPIPHTGSSTGGMMDVAIDPDYESNAWVYLSYSYTDEDPADKKAPALTTVVRGKIVDNQWTNEQILFRAHKAIWPVEGNRWGCRLLFDAEQHLYFTIGDMALDTDSQDLSKATGKVFRINKDGSIPKDNPFLNVADALPQIYTIGNRNTQGLSIHPKTKEMWSTDHGPLGGDELNILTKGANYGWPLITYGVDYSGDIVSDNTHLEGMEQPVTHWTPSIGICALEFFNSPLFTKWNNDLVVGGLAFQELKLLRLEADKVIDQELILKNMGRVRDIHFSPKGELYVLLNNPNKLIRITPIQES